jgi:hypothetical protein
MDLNAIPADLKHIMWEYAKPWPHAFQVEIEVKIHDWEVACDFYNLSFHSDNYEFRHSVCAQMHQILEEDVGEPYPEHYGYHAADPNGRWHNSPSTRIQNLP